ncbi:MAG: hypothetical protein GF308_03725 [Candidatus Heimdallarchaeota archaeon]|nr:hypothetical protein [Candidatus Heimdallarchaeota archaeon]
MTNEEQKIDQLRNRLKKYKNSCPSHSYFDNSQKWSLAGVIVDKEQVEKILLTLMQDEDPIVRWKAIELVRETKVQSEVIIKKLIEHMRSDSSTFVKSEAALTLCLFGKDCTEAVSVIKKGLKVHKNWLMCYHSTFAIYCLVKNGIKIDQVFDDLERLSGENHPQCIRNVATQALKKIKEQG